MTRFFFVLIALCFAVAISLNGLPPSQATINDCSLEGKWTQNSEGLGPSTWTITADGEAIESGLGNAKGRATLSGGKLRIEWTIAGYNNSGYYEWTLDGTCESGSGVAVNTVSGVTRKTTVRKTGGPPIGAAAIRAELSNGPAEVWVAWGRDPMAVGICIRGFIPNSPEPLKVECPDSDNSFGDHLVAGDRFKTVRISTCGEIAAPSNWAGHTCSKGPGYFPGDGPAYLWGLFISAPARDLENDLQPGRPRDICIGTNPVTIKISQKGAGETFVTLAPQLVLKAGGIGGGGTYDSSNCTGDARGTGRGGVGGGGDGGGGGLISQTWGGPEKKVSLQLANGNYLTAVGGGGVRGPGAIHSDATKASGWEVFTLVPLPDRTYAIRTADGHYLTAMQGGGLTGTDVIHTDATKIDAWEKFTLWNLGGGMYALKTASGHFLTVVKGGRVGGNDAAIHTNATKAGSWESFKLVDPR